MHYITFLMTLLLTASLSLIAGLPNRTVMASEVAQPAIANHPTAPLFDNLGQHHHPISTDQPRVQQYFDQGLTLAYGFNHLEAARSFQAATELDPDCAMCYWGLAYVQGPNINAPMAAEAIPTAYEAIQQAMTLRDRAPAREQAYIEALAQRYAESPPEDRSALDVAYANAMRQVAQQYPDDLDAATLFAEALMDTIPWDYWDETGAPRPEGAEVMATLESVLARNPEHIGANHLYIHTVEKERPDLGIAAADHLRDRVPGAGHLVHMPSHIYIRVGRYHDAVTVNQQAIEADRAYASQHPSQGIYAQGYMPHNHHFLWFAAVMTGQSQVALNAAQQTAAVDEASLHDPELGGSLQHYSMVPLYTLTRFQQWDDILATPAPAADLKYSTGVWHYARGMALAATEQFELARRELQQLQAIAADPETATVKIWGFNSAQSILNLATEVLAGEIAAQAGDYDTAIAHLQTAATQEDHLIYTEPADWCHPVRQMLGAVLLQADRPAEAEAAYRQDLEIYPENGWSLWGLTQSLQAQGKTEEAIAVQQRFEQAWQYSDIVL